MSITKTGKRLKEDTLRKVIGAVGVGFTPRPRAGTKEKYLYLWRRVPGTGRVVWQYLTPQSELGDLTHEHLNSRLAQLQAKYEAAQRGEKAPARELPPIDADKVLAAIGEGATLKDIAERLGVSARSPRLKVVIQQLEAEGRIKSGRWYVVVK